MNAFTVPHRFSRAARTAALLLLAALFALVGCSSGDGRMTTKDGMTVFEDEYARCELPEGYFIAVDSTEEMGTFYHAYLMFKHRSDNTGSQIVYFSSQMKPGAYTYMVLDRESVTAQLLSSYKAKGQTAEIIDFRNVTQPRCRGYVIEYRTNDGKRDITQILFNAVTYSNESVTFMFNCAEESLLPGMRAAAESITLKQVN